MVDNDFKGVINGFISDKQLNNYITISNVRDAILCVDKRILKNSNFDEINEILNISVLLNEKVYDLTDFECFKIILGCSLFRKPDIIVCDNCFCNMDCKSRKELVLLFTQLRRLKLCKFIIRSNDEEILASICDYIVTDSVSGKVPEIYEKMNSNVPFTVLFSKRVQELKAIKMGYRTKNEDLMKDVYRYVK